MRITNAGNVGIGTDSPNSRLDVNGDMQISNASIPMGLLTEVGGTTPLLNMSVNFLWSNKNTTYRGGAFRIDTRDSVPLFQWNARSAGNTTGSITMVLTESGSVGIGTTDPKSKLEVNGPIATAVVKKTNADSPYTATADDSVILVDAVGGAVTITLPTASTCPGRIYTIKKIDLSGNVVTIGPSVDGVGNYPLNAQSKYISVISDGTNWYVISEGIGLSTPS